MTDQKELTKPSPVPFPELTLVSRDEQCYDTRYVSLQILQEVRALTQRIEKIESDAQDMMSPDKMMEIAGKFLGGGL